MEWKHEVAEELGRVRARTLALLDAIPAALLTRQAGDFLSPPLWDFGHIANFEETWLVRAVGGDGAAPPPLDERYDPFRQPRQRRGEVPLPSPDRARDYMRAVRRRTLQLLARVGADGRRPLLHGGFVYWMVCQHEAQHQETLLQSLDLFEAGEGGDGLRLPLDTDWGNRMPPDVAPEVAARKFRPTPAVDDSERLEVPAGPFDMGTDDRRRSYDNERRRHRVEVGAFRIDRFPVTVRRWRQFVDDGGYQERRWWSEEGWATCRQDGWEHPQGWRRDTDGSWRLLRFGHWLPLDERQPVQHVSYYEAEAFARWAGGRLPTEAEWEKVAAFDPDDGSARPFPWGHEAPTPERANLDWSRAGPRRIASVPAGASALGAEQLLGDVYEWTASPFEAYPGFEAFPYREYSEVFFGGGPYRVLRGASWAAGPLLARNTYRNWDLPGRRQLFAGVRLAWAPT